MSRRANGPALTAMSAAEIDSYYEYLLKCSVLFGDKDCQTMWEDSISKINTYLADEGEHVDKGKFRGELSSNDDLWYGHADMNTGKRTATTTGALDAFFPAVLAFDGDLNRARALQDSMFKMWELNDIEPEVYNYKTGKIEDPGYPLRPEIVESTYYLYHLHAGPKISRDGAGNVRRLCKILPHRRSLRRS